MTADRTGSATEGATPIVIPGGHGRAIRLNAGQSARIVNTFGTQVIDLWAVAIDDPDDWLSMDHTRSVLSKLTPAEGDVLVSRRRRPMLKLEQDTSPGVHDTLLCPCNAALYAALGADPDHRSCEGNLIEAMADVGARVSGVPASFNVFMNVGVGPDGGLLRGDPVSRPGDSVTFRAMQDVWLVLSACPQDITAINGPDRTPRPVSVFVLPSTNEHADHG